MTTPTNRPPDDGLEERLAATFGRAVKHAEVDLADGRLAAEAIDRGHRRDRTGAVWRAGLVLAAVAVLSAGTLWVVGGRPSPSPSPSTTQGLLPTDANGSQVPQAAWPSQIPSMNPGSTLPPTFDGKPVYAVGGTAEDRIGAAADATPFLVSGWVIPLARPAGCGDFSFGSPTPNGVYFRDCSAWLLWSTANRGTSMKYFISSDFIQNAALTLSTESTQVTHVIVMVHVHDPGCAIPDCAYKPVIEAFLLSAETRLDPAIVNASMPPGGVSLDKAIKTGLAELLTAYGTGYVNVVAVDLGTGAALNDPNVHGDPATTWEWKIVVSTTDGRSVASVYVDYLTGESNHSGGSDNGSLGVP